MQDLAQTLLSVPLTTGFFVMTLGSARILGALFGLWGLYFVLGPAGLMRIVLAVILSGPLLVGQADAFLTLATDTQRLALFLVPAREFVLGFGLGLLVSLPFFSVLGAAMLIDQYRGDFSPGNQAPEGQTVGSYATLNFVMVLFLFVEAGGFIVLISVVYQSYGVIPPAVPGLQLSPDFTDQLGDLLQSIMVSLVIFALPVILILLLLEFGINMLARMTEPVKMPSIDFLAKNIALTLLMPILIFGLIRLMRSAIENAPPPLAALLRLIGA